MLFVSLAITHIVLSADKPRPAKYASQCGHAKHVANLVTFDSVQHVVCATALTPQAQDSVLIPPKRKTPFVVVNTCSLETMAVLLSKSPMVCMCLPPLDSFGPRIVGKASYKPVTKPKMLVGMVKPEMLKPHRVIIICKPSIHGPHEPDKPAR